jgi:Mg-chelatase subunit ChlD
MVTTTVIRLAALFRHVANAGRFAAYHALEFGRRTMRVALSLITGGVVLLAVTPSRAQNDPAGQVKDVAGNKPKIELVFVIDTTGSMGGLIEGAKQKIWGIVNEVMKSPSKPEVRMGLVAYRDHGDAYVTQILPVTRDLDKVYETLMAYRAEGGGDTPEDVRQALADGVHKVGWSPRSPNIAQILFLVGDAPPHED